MRPRNHLKTSDLSENRGKTLPRKKLKFAEADQQETNKRSFWRRTLLFTDSSGIIPWTHWRPILEVDYCHKRCLRIKLDIKFWFGTYEMGFGRYEVPRFLVSKADCSSKVAREENSPLKWWAPCSQISRKKKNLLNQSKIPCAQMCRRFIFYLYLPFN